MPIRDNINRIKSTLPTNVALVAVSKFHPEAAILQAYEAGQRIFGESRPQEMAAKHASLPTDIEWHFIGHLQRNKISMISPFVALIHSVDSFRLLDELSKEAVRIGRTLKVLLQVHIAQETSKQGFTSSEIREIMSHPAPQGIEIAGLMGMATYTDDLRVVHSEFEGLRSLFDEFSDLSILSMGMSDDYRLAIECGSNMVRIGSSIFGNRT